MLTRHDFAQSGLRATALTVLPGTQALSAQRLEVTEASMPTQVNAPASSFVFANTALHGKVSGVTGAARGIGRATGRGSGAITTSTQGQHDTFDTAAYSTCKWRLIGLMKSAALELGKHGVRVDALVPGLIDTPLTRHEERHAKALEISGKTPAGDAAKDEATAREDLAKASPLGVPLTDPADIAPVAVLLASKASRVVAGATYELKGGIARRLRPSVLPRFRYAWALCGGFLLLSCITPSIRAQGNSPRGGAGRSTWLMYFGDHAFTKNWSLHLEGQYRRQGIGQRWEQLLLRPGVSRKLGHGVSTMIAYTYLRDYPFEGGSLGDPTTTGPQPEHRILEEVKIKHRLFGKDKQAVTLSHRMRAEQRFEGTSTAGIGTTAWNFADPARYRLTADIPFRWNTAGARPDYASVYNEVFVNFGPHGGTRAFNQDRTYGAVGWDLSKDIHFEVGYLYQHNPAPSGVVDTDNHALQFTISSSAPLHSLLGR